MVEKSKALIILNSVDLLPVDQKPTAVTIGKFDGIHLGHKELLAETVRVAQQQNLVPTVVTFDRHPKATLNPNQAPSPIVGDSQKKELLQNSNIEMVLSLTFNDELAHSSPRDFVIKTLVMGLKSKSVLVGSGFRFGAEAKGDVDLLKELGAEFGFEVHVVEPVKLDGNVVSSSKIRELLDHGDVSKAAELLGRLHSTRGMVEHGLKIGRKLGFPTANISRDAEGLLPKDGVYAGWLHAQGERYPAALSIGINETIVEVPRLLEVHVLDRNDLDLYDQVVNVEYVDFIRPALKFNGVDELIAAINADLDKIRQILG